MSLFNTVLYGIQKKRDAQNAYKDIIIGCIRDVIGTMITHDAVISCKDGVLTLRLNPTIKMALLLKQTTLIKSLKQKGLTVSNIK